MTPSDERPQGDPENEGTDERALTRKQFVTTAIGAAVAVTPLLSGAARAATYRTAATARAAKGKVVIGAFKDGGLTPFKDKIIPLFQRETGIKVEFLEDDYSTFFEKAFQDGVAKAGQFDVYVMDDPWIPQYSSAPVLQNLSKLGFQPDSDYMKPFLDLGWWPPKSGPRLPQFKNATPQLYALPFVGDMQSLTYRKDAFGHSPKTWTELVTVAKAKMKPPQSYGYVFRGVKGNSIASDENLVALGPERVRQGLQCHRVGAGDLWKLGAGGDGNHHGIRWRLDPLPPDIGSFLHFVDEHVYSFLFADGKVGNGKDSRIVQIQGTASCRETAGQDQRECTLQVKDEKGPRRRKGR